MPIPSGVLIDEITEDIDVHGPGGAFMVPDPVVKAKLWNDVAEMRCAPESLTASTCMRSRLRGLAHVDLHVLRS